MRCIVGLGNPGRKYDYTRHNIGFMVIDAISDALNIELNQKKFKTEYGVGVVNGEKVMLVKPVTFMNLSGEGVRPLIDYYNIELDDVLILYDDLDFNLGTIKLRQKGSGGGHNGIKSLSQHFGTDKYKRIRIGIGRPVETTVVKYVLSKFPKEETQLVSEVVDYSRDAAIAFIDTSFQDVMTKYNGDVHA